MILDFSIKNFLSFKDKVTLDLNASFDNSLEENFINFNDEKVLKSAAIYGANASGKSNLFKALDLVRQAITHSSMNAPNSPLFIIPFMFDTKSKLEPSEFEINFLKNDIKYYYYFKADNKNVYEEKLYSYPNGRQSVIFERTNIVDIEYPKDKKILNEIKKMNTPNKFFLATATTWNYEKTKDAYDFFDEDLVIFSDLKLAKNYALNKYSENNKKLKDFALKFLEHADINIDNFYVEKIETKTDNVLTGNMNKLEPFEKDKFVATTIHKVNGKEYSSQLRSESLGTQVLFSFIPALKDILDKGKIVFIDELDRSLHPHLVNYILNIFNDNKVNKNNAQLVFNTHDTNLMNLDVLRRDQIWFVEKNSNAESELYPLDDFSVRKDDRRIEQNYLLGRYGAIPTLIKL